MAQVTDVKSRQRLSGGETLLLAIWRKVERHGH
jgi:hypothetical protein